LLRLINGLQMKGFFRELIITVGLAVIIFLVLQTTIQSSIVDGSSMEPGLDNGQRLIVAKIAYNFKEPQRGDVIIIHPPVAPQKQWVKRIIGIPGDVIEVKQGIVFVNNVPLTEPYIKSPPSYVLAPYTVAEDNYFVMGDNRNNSTDSHYGWTVSKDNIVGEVWLRIWPFSQWGIIQAYPLADELYAASSN
jgi:signal peptidase I